MGNTSRRLGSLVAVVLGVTGISMVAQAQNSGSAPPQPSAQASPPAGEGYRMMGDDDDMGPGMTEGYHGMGLGMMDGRDNMGGRWRNPKVSIVDRLATLKDELKITADELDPWNVYAAAVTTAEQGVVEGMKSMWQLTGTKPTTPDQRFDSMSKIIALMKQNYEQGKVAADTLMKHLTPYQQGQASEILPGLATRHGGCGGGMMGWGIMGQGRW